MAASTSEGICLQVLLILLASLTLRVCVSMWGHSGQGKPPMFGDLEAQRHWMEVTVNLPVTEWYTESPHNDLQYWGLDYPPLTAYHMMLNGKIALRTDPRIVALNVSHGLEDLHVKLFLRATVLVMDVLVFLPAAAAFFWLQRSQVNTDSQLLGFVAVMVIYPGLILIDNGHFQYNNVSLGLLVLATLAMARQHEAVAAGLFCCALNYKQMELYHALPFFAYLLGICVKAPVIHMLKKLILLAVIVLGTFVTIWSPFLGTMETAAAVVHRLFPLKRGLYEDKVANFWCSVSVLIKFKEKFADSDMAMICLLVTTVCLLPSFLHLLRNPGIASFHYALVNISFVFFLFSFHVHEKSILLVAIPACLVVKPHPLAVIWFLLISVFRFPALTATDRHWDHTGDKDSEFYAGAEGVAFPNVRNMLPLLLKDDLLIPTLAITCLFWVTVTHFLNPTRNVSLFTRNLFTLSMLTALGIAVATLLIPAPKRFPDLFPLLISIFSCGHFMLFALYFHLRQFGMESFLFQVTSKLEFHDNFSGNTLKSAELSGDNDDDKSPQKILNITKVAGSSIVVTNTRKVTRRKLH